ncbi:hypothetical protein HDU87_004745 [Geranomyces variabilis]|uniref:[histone H3]-trimethyl-L-lysine(9) demethylase n=1 Tax=Geranomyces variabilis TaxID=109894 RepID=A0AAD5XLQ6_9FUNG|nr:hypothetical protein HDU87_004745 [Geranomyces variabilis]
MDPLNPPGGLAAAVATADRHSSPHHHPHLHLPEAPASCMSLPTLQQAQCAPPSPPITADHRKTPSILPSFYYEPKGVPVFKPTLEEFEDFAAFMQAIDGHGKAAGIVKVIPPPEWSARLPDITPALSTVKIRKPITQEISGGGLPPGAYFQANIEQRRTYTVQDWHDVCNSKAQKAPVLDSKGKLHFQTEPNIRKRFRKKEPNSPEKGETLSVVAEPDQKIHYGAETLMTAMDGVEAASVPAPLPPPPPTQDLQASTLDNNSAIHASLPAERPAQEPQAATLSEAAAINAPSPPVKLAQDSLPFTLEGNAAAIVDDAMDATKGKAEAMEGISETAVEGLALKEEMHGCDTALVDTGPSNTEDGNVVDAAGASELPSTDDQAPPRKGPRKRTAPPKPTPVSFDPSVTSSGFTDEYCAELERFYWRNIAYAAPMYGADMLGSLFDADDVRNILESSQKTNSWNLAHLDNLLKRVKAKLPGVTMPYLYFGMWKATFAWHVEDMDLYSINYIHFGAPKQWYVVPPDVRDKFERVATETFLHEAEKCPEFLRHKTSILSPKYLASRGVNVNRVVQRAGEFMITFPYGYHQGFNFGFNCAESVNFALESWVEIGKQAGHCKCVGDSVKLDVAGIFDPPTVTDNSVVHAAGMGEGIGAKHGFETGVARPHFEGQIQTGDGRPGNTLKLHIKKPQKQQSKQLDKELHKVLKQRKPKDPNAPKRIRRPKAPADNGQGWVQVDSATGTPSFDASHLKSGAATMTGVRISLVSRPANPTPVPQITCVLCVDPYGPLLPTDKEKLFAHRQCAIFVPAAEIVTGIDLIERARWRLKCALCKPKSAQKATGACIQCARGKCVRAYHVSCAAKAEGVKMVADTDVPHCFCPQHDPDKLLAKWADRDQWIQRANEVIAENMTVWAKIEGRWYEGVVINVFREKWSSRIQFVDGGLRTVPWSLTRIEPPEQQSSCGQEPSQDFPGKHGIQSSEGSPSIPKPTIPPASNRKLFEGSASTKTESLLSSSTSVAHPVANGNENQGHFDRSLNRASAPQPAHQQALHKPYMHGLTNLPREVQPAAQNLAADVLATTCGDRKSARPVENLLPNTISQPSVQPSPRYALEKPSAPSLHRDQLGDTPSTSAPFSSYPVSVEHARPISFPPQHPAFQQPWRPWPREQVGPGIPALPPPPPAFERPDLQMSQRYLPLLPLPCPSVSRYPPAQGHNGFRPTQPELSPKRMQGQVESAPPASELMGS